MNTQNRNKPAGCSCCCVRYIVTYRLTPLTMSIFIHKQNKNHNNNNETLNKNNHSLFSIQQIFDIRRRFVAYFYLIILNHVSLFCFSVKLETSQYIYHRHQRHGYLSLLITMFLCWIIFFSVVQPIYHMILLWIIYAIMFRFTMPKMNTSDNSSTICYLWTFEPIFCYIYMYMNIQIVILCGNAKRKLTRQW